MEAHSRDCSLCCGLSPTEFNKDFRQDFANFVSGIILEYDHFLIVGDFNVHVCCETRPLVKDFLNLIDSLNLTQSVSEPTHEKDHIWILHCHMDWMYK